MWVCIIKRLGFVLKSQSIEFHFNIGPPTSFEVCSVITRLQQSEEDADVASAVQTRGEIAGVLESFFGCLFSAKSVEPAVQFLHT